MRFIFSTPKEIARGMKRIWGSKMGTPSLARIIQDVDLALKALEVFYLATGTAVEGLADSNGHRRKVVGEGKSVPTRNFIATFQNNAGVENTYVQFVFSQHTIFSYT